MARYYLVAYHTNITGNICFPDISSARRTTGDIQIAQLLPNATPAHEVNKNGVCVSTVALNTRHNCKAVKIRLQKCRITALHMKITNI